MAQTGIQRADDGTVTITTIFSAGELDALLGSTEPGAPTATPVEPDPAAAGTETQTGLEQNAAQEPPAEAEPPKQPSQVEHRVPPREKPAPPPAA